MADSLAVKLKALRGVESDCGALPADDQPVAVMLDLMNPIGPDGGVQAMTGWAGMMNPAGKRLLLIAAPSRTGAMRQF
jgi:hypothetical protein